MSAPRISFVIPHKGREHFLRQTLASIAAQDAEENIEVIVMTQNATLESATTAAAEPVSLKVVHAEPQLTIAALRNRGVREARGEFLAFLDADIQLSPDWLRKLIAILAGNPAIALASAMQLSGDNAPPLERIRTVLSNAIVDAPVAFLPGRNLLLTRESFETAGGFPEHLVTCEDFYFTDRIAAQGQLWYTGDAHYVHLGEDKRLDEMFRKEIWRGQSNLQSLRGRRVAPGEWPSFIVPLWISVMLLLAIALALSAAVRPALVALLAAALPFSVYVTRLYFLANRRLALQDIVAFYACYFPARAWGSILGVFRTLGSNLHNR